MGKEAKNEAFQCEDHTTLARRIRGTESEKLFEDHHIYNHLELEARQ